MTTTFQTLRQMKNGSPLLERGAGLRSRKTNASVVANAARVIVIQVNNAKGSDIAEVLVRGRRRIARFTAKREAPFVAAIYWDGRVREYSIA